VEALTVIHIYGDLWSEEYDRCWRVITTNGFVKRNGQVVMGRGCAREAATRHPDLPLRLGRLLKRYGNRMFVFRRYRLITFPVKHNWWEKADKELITRSARELYELAVGWSGEVFILPRPGCGNGGLRWSEVGPLLSFLPDNVWVITREQEEGKDYGSTGVDAVKGSCPGPG